MLFFKDEFGYDLNCLGSEQKKTKQNENTLKKHTKIVFKNKVKSGDFFFVFDPKHKKAGLIRPN